MNLQKFFLLVCLLSWSVSTQAQKVQYDVTFQTEGISWYIQYSIYNNSGKLLVKKYSDRQGKLTLRLPDGKYRYDTNGGIGYAPSSGSFVVSGKPQYVNISYKDYFPVHFVVKNDLDSILQGMRIEILKDDQLVTYAFSMEKGKDIYLPAGTYTYTVSGQKMNPKNGVLKVEVAKTFVVKIHPYRKACFCIKNSTGEAVPGVKISYSPLNTSGTDSETLIIETDSTGLACTPEIPSGKYQVFTNLYPEIIWRYNDTEPLRVRINNRHVDTLLLGSVSDTILIWDKRRKIHFKATNALGEPLPKAMISLWGGPDSEKYPGYYRDYIDYNLTSISGEVTLLVVPGKYRYVAGYNAGKIWNTYSLTRPIATDWEKEYSRTDGWIEISDNDITITKQYNVYPLKIVASAENRRFILIRGLSSIDYYDFFEKELLVNLPNAFYEYTLTVPSLEEVIQRGTFEINGKAEVLKIE